MAGNNKSKRKSAGTRRTIRTVTPVTFRQSSGQEEMMIFRPYFCLEAFRQQTPVFTDWIDLSFRLMVGHELAQRYYIDIVVKEMEEIVLVMRAIRNRYHESGQTVLRATATEIDMIRMGLEATDEMQLDTSRREQLEAYSRVIQLTENTIKTPNVLALQ